MIGALVFLGIVMAGAGVLAIWVVGERNRIHRALHDLRCELLDWTEPGWRGGEPALRGDAPRRDEAGGA